MALRSDFIPVDVTVSDGRFMRCMALKVVLAYLNGRNAA